jgi:bis(5'-nucleosidyl)-tetraphosphatase
MDVAAAGVILFTAESPHQFLLMRHTNRWDLPKGHLDPGEDLITCALREMQEETGIDPAHVRVDSDFQFAIQYDVTYRETGDQIFHKTVTIFLAWVDHAMPIAPIEHEGYQWFDWQPPHQFDNPTIDPLLAQVALWLPNR